MIRSFFLFLLVLVTALPLGPALPQLLGLAPQSVCEEEEAPEAPERDAEGKAQLACEGRPARRQLRQRRVSCFTRVAHLPPSSRAPAQVLGARRRPGPDLPLRT